MALTFDQISAITDAYYMPKFPELVFDKNIIMSRLWRKGSKISSGEFFKQPVMYQATKGGAYSPYEVFDVSAEDQVTAARFDLKYYEVPITVSRDEILKNDGPEGVKKLMDAKMKLAGMRMSDLIATDLWSITSTDSSKEISSIPHMVDDASHTLTASATYGGIDRSTYSWWQGTLTDHGGGAITALSSELSPAMSTAWFDIADGDEHPTLIVADPAFLDAYWKDARPDKRFLDEKMLSMGWTAMQFNGIPFVGDRHCPSYSATPALNAIYFLDEDYMDFASHSKENMRLEPFAKPIDQNVSVAHIYYAGNMTCSYPARSGALHNFTID